ncbi:hypothetical protein PENTCL1PPCAC_28790, partial [Pristionchus entomophagus]
LLPRLPPRYSSLPRRSNANGRAANSQWSYEQSEPGPSFSNGPVPAPFTRDYQHQSSSRSYTNQPYHNRKQSGMGNAASSQVREAGPDLQPREWLHAPPTQQQLQQQQGPGRPQPSSNRRAELEFAAEHSVLPEGPRVRSEKKRKSLKKRFGSFISYTIRTVVNAINGTSGAERRARAENSQPPPKRTQSLTRIDTRSEEVSHRRTQSVRVPTRRRDEQEEEMPRQPLRAAKAEALLAISNGNRGLNNIGNTCYLAAAIQAIRPVVTNALKGDFWRVTENTEDLMAIKTLFDAMELGSDDTIQTAFEIFVDVFCRLRSINRGDQDDASLCMVDILSRLQDRTKRPQPPPVLKMMRGLPPHEEYYLKNKAEESSPFYDLTNSILQTKSICFKCGSSSLTFHSDTLIPCVIPPEIKLIEEYPPLRASYVRSVAGRCHNIRAHLNRYPANIDPTICELKHEMFDHELISPFDLTRTEVFTHGRDGWDRLNMTDISIVRHRRNEFLSVVEFPYDIENRLVVLLTYGGDSQDAGPLFFSMKMTSTVQELRDQMRDYLRAYHPFPCDVFIKREYLSKQPEQFEEVQLMGGGVFCEYDIVLENIAVLKDAFPHLPSFIRVTCKFDTSAVNDCVSLHRSAAKPKYARQYKFRIDVDYVLKSYMHATRVEWRCANGHTDKSGQIISYCYPAEFIFIQIRRVDHNYNGSTYKVRDHVHVPTLIDIAPIFRQDWPDHDHEFKTPLTHRPRLMYEVVSVISHEGGTTNSGHYTTVVHNPETKTFTKYNDDMVREASLEAIHLDPFVVIYRRKPTASFTKTNYGIEHFAPDSEAIHRTAERKAEQADERTEGNIVLPDMRRSRSHVKFDKTNEPRYHPDRPPADLKGSKRKKSKK